MKHYNVVCAIVSNDNEILCMQKGLTKFEYTSYHWEFPGGKIETGESPQEALHRELLEEMEYDIVVGECICSIDHTYPDFSITMQAYMCHADTRSFKMKEHVDYKWLKLSQLHDLQWCDADTPIVCQLSNLLA